MSSSWTESNGYRTKTVQMDGYTVIIHRPVLTKEETKKREREILNALSCYGRDSMQRGGAANA